MSMMTELSFLGEVFPQNAKRVCTYVPFLSVFPSVHRAESSYSAYHWIYQELLKCIWKSSICQQDVKKMCNCANNSFFFPIFPQQMMPNESLAVILKAFISLGALYGVK